MSGSAWHGVVCGLLAVLVPAQLMGGELAAAMLYTNGPAWVNGSEVPKSGALFTGDLLQTRADATANIQAAGTNVMVMADSLVKIRERAVELKHGSVRVTTARGLAAQAGEVTVKPVSDAWTEFQVTDVDGRVQIAAAKGDVTVQDEKGTTTVSQGQQTTRDDTSDVEKKKKRRRAGGAAAPGAVGGLLNSNAAVYGGVALAAGAGIWLLLQEETPLSGKCLTVNCK